MRQLDSRDRAILRRVQGDLPAGRQPFDAWARELGIAPDELLERIRTLKAQGIIREFKAILRHQEVGIRANAMVVWAVSEAESDRVGRLIARHPEVTHCYERPAFGAYRIFSMVHGTTRQEVEDLVHELACELACEDYRIYWSVRELKKVSMQYVGEDDGE